MPDAEIAIDDPRADDVRALLERHLAFANRHSPPEDVHALDVDALATADITFFSLRRDGELLGVGALKQLDDAHAEIKSMHTADAARGHGLARAMVEHLTAVARERGARRVSIETGAQPAFAPARALYAGAGFQPCGPFGDYVASRNSVHMTLAFEPASEGGVAKLTYSAIASLDGFVADRDGRVDWCAPDEEVHAFVNDLERPVGTYLYGRRMYEVMASWETAGAGQNPVHRDFAELWRAADKVVYSKTLERVSSSRTRLERDFDPQVVRQAKASAQRDLSVGGPDLAAQAIRAGLVDELHLFVAPIVVGGGTLALPRDVVLELELQDERRFGNGVVYLRYLTDT